MRSHCSGCCARHVGDGKQTRSCLLEGLCRPLWEQPSRLNCAVEELDSQATQALSEVARDQDAKHSKDHADWLEAWWVLHQLSCTRWAQSLSVLPRVVFWSCVSSRSNVLEILEAQIRAELNRRVNENDLRHKEKQAVFPQYLEALGTKLSVEMVRMQSDHDAKLEKQYHTLLDAQDTSYLSTRLLVRPDRRVDLQASSCFLTESCIISLVVLWYPKSSMSHVSLRVF